MLAFLNVATSFPATALEMPVGTSYDPISGLRIPVLNARSVSVVFLIASKIYKYSASAQNHRCSTSPGSIPRYRNLYFRREALARVLTNRYSRLSERGTRLNRTGDNGTG